MFDDYYLGPPYKFHQKVIDDCYNKANSKQNLAVQLVKTCYSKRERATSNCAGDHRYGKKKLFPNRMKAVKNAIYTMHPIRTGEVEKDV